MVIDIPAFHRMEYIDAVIVNKVIQDFQGVAIPVKADKQIFIFAVRLAPVKPAVIFGSIMLSGTAG
jgi:hypothetical protein